MSSIAEPYLIIAHGQLTSENLVWLTRKLKDLGDIFSDKEAYNAMDGDAVVYDVVSSFPRG